MHWVDESEPFPGFLKTCSVLELVALQHDARQKHDVVTLRAVLAELKQRDVGRPRKAEAL